MTTSLVKKYIFPTVLIIVIIFGLRFALQTLIAKHDAATLSSIDAQVNAEKSQLIAVADATRRNSGDPAVDAVVLDCSTGDRNRFDTLLDELSKNISSSDLNELHGLFYKCANYFALKKSVSTMRLSREVETYSALKKMRNQIQKYPTDITSEIDTWKKIADSETKWSSFFSDLVTYQETIINLFLAGKNAQSPEVIAVLEKVKNARAQLEVFGSQIAEFRSSISSI
jgi:hypothetical protein